MNSAIALASLLFLSTLGLALAAETAPAAPKRTVYGWFPKDMDPKINEDWSTKAIDWSALTHICFRAVTLKPDGKVEIGWGTTPERIKNLVAEAHKHGVKVTVLAWGTNAKGSSEYLAKHADEIVQGLLDFVKAHNLDGVNMDDETWSKENAETKGPNRELVTAFFKLLHDKFKAARADYHLSWASGPVISAEDKYGDAWPDYKAIADYIDAFTFMSYCMCPPTAGWTGSAQPVAGGGKVGNHARDYSTAIDDYLAATGGRKEKLMLGIGNARGGTEWDAKTAEPLSGFTGKPRALTPEQARTNAEKYGRKFDAKQQSPWYCYKNGDAFVQGWYEDDESLAAKLKLARDKDLQGVCFWVLDGVKEPPETFKLVHQNLFKAESAAK